MVVCGKIHWCIRIVVEAALITDAGNKLEQVFIADETAPLWKIISNETFISEI